MNKRSLWVLVTLATVFSQALWSFDSPHTVQDRVLVGAIRWDAWIGDLKKGTNKTGLIVERNLSPNKYHYRAPFYATVVGPDSIQARETTQSIMDQDIEYAKNGGIDYWAFVWYSNGTGLETARNLYFSSSNRNDVHWCLIISPPFNFNTDGAWLIEKFKEPIYQKVLHGRPLVYLYDPGHVISGNDVIRLRERCKTEGVDDPYIALMHTGPLQTASVISDSLGADALSMYNSFGSNDGGPYSPFIPNLDKQGWNSFKALKHQVVPWVTSGKNIKPRIDNPVPWMTVRPDAWTADGTPGQIAQNVKNAVDWTRQNTETAQANAIIIYAWNEFDEGGWICPTLGNDDNRLKAIKTALRR